MRKWVVGVVVLGGMVMASTSLYATDEFAGQWYGAIETPDEAIPVELTLEHSAGGWQGSIGLPTQGAEGLPLGNIQVDAQHVSFDLVDMPGNPTLSGSLQGDRIVGEFSQGGGALPVELGRERPDRPAVPTPEEAAAVIDGQLEAYNRHDIDAFVGYFHDDIALFGFPDRARGSGKAQLRAQFEQAFEAMPHERVLSRIVQGPHVIDHVSVRFTIGGREVEHTGTVIYTLSDGLIQRMTYLD